MAWQTNKTLKSTPKRTQNVNIENEWDLLMRRCYKKGANSWIVLNALYIPLLHKKSHIHCKAPMFYAWRAQNGGSSMVVLHLTLHTLAMAPHIDEVLEMSILINWLPPFKLCLHLLLFVGCNLLKSEEQVIVVIINLVVSDHLMSKCAWEQSIWIMTILHNRKLNQWLILINESRWIHIRHF